MTSRLVWLILVLLAPCRAASAQAPASQAAPGAAVAELCAEARKLEGWVESDLARALLRAAPRLPKIAPRTLYRDPETRVWHSERAAQALDAAAREKLESRVVDESFYYHTKYGTPLAYARAIDLLGRDERAPWAGWAGRRVLDFGYGTIGHLRLLALNGADVVGVDVDTLLTALYSEPSDTAPLPGIEGPQGNITLVEGHFPGDAPVRAKVGGGFDLFLSKNTLKRGYVHPSRPADERMLLNLGVDDETYVRAVFDLLKPGGRFMIYNICPPPSPPDEPYKPWSDGRCPFDKELLERVGFEVASFDVDDTPALREMARLLAWDARHDIDNDLFAWFTLARRPPTGVERGF